MTWTLNVSLIPNGLVIQVPLRTLSRGDGRRCALLRVRFLSELQMAEGKERAVNTGFEGQSRIQEDDQVENTPTLLGCCHALPPSLCLSPRTKGSPFP